MFSIDEEIDDGIEDESVSIAATALARSPCPDLRGELINTAYKLTWIEEINVDKLVNFVSDGILSDRYTSPAGHLWRGASWRLLLTREESTRAINVYLEMRRDDSTPSDEPVSRTVSFTFYLFNNRRRDDAITGLTHDYTFKLGRNHIAIDQGQPNYFRNLSRNVLMDSQNGYLYPAEEVNAVGTLRIGVSVESQIIITPSALNYNSREQTDMVGLANLGATCYLNALLQMLYHLPAFRKAVYSTPATEATVPDSEPRPVYSIIFALQIVFWKLQTETKEVSPDELTQAFGWTTVDSYMQQDVQEMMRILLDKLEELMKGTVVDGVIGGLFQGKIRSYIRCLNIEYTSEREEDFYDIQLEVEGCGDILESIRRYTAREVLSGDNQYDAGEGRGKQDAEKGIDFTLLPPVLTIHLKRFHFNLQRMGFSKIHDYFSFPLQLNMREFLSATCDAAGSIRQGCTEYSLHSVLVHVGEVGSGHYYAFIHTEGGAGNGPRWFKFDDDLVFAVGIEEAVYRNFGRRRAQEFPDALLQDLHPEDMAGGYNSTASAYMLVYVRNDSLAEVMMPLPADSIPMELIQRVNADVSRRLWEDRLRRHADQLIRVCVHSEASVRAWSKLDVANDLLDDTHHSQLCLIRGDFSVLGLLFCVANLAEISPERLVLFSLREKGLEKKEPCLRIGKPIDNFADGWEGQKLLLRNLHSLGLYMHELPPVDDPDLLIGYRQLRHDELRLLRDMRTALSQIEVLVEGPLDWLEGCGIGRGHVHISSLFLAEQAREFGARLAELDRRALELVRKRDRDFLEESLLVFFRACDPGLSLQRMDSYPFVYLGSKFVDLCEDDDDDEMCSRLYEECQKLLTDMGAETAENEDWGKLKMWVAASSTKWDPIEKEVARLHGDIVYCQPKFTKQMAGVELNRFELFKRDFVLVVEGYSNGMADLRQNFLQFEGGCPRIQLLLDEMLPQVISKVAELIGLGDLASSLILKCSCTQRAASVRGRTIPESFPFSVASEVTSLGDFLGISLGDSADTIHVQVTPFPLTPLEDRDFSFYELIIADATSRIYLREHLEDTDESDKDRERNGDEDDEVEEEVKQVSGLKRKYRSLLQEVDWPHRWEKSLSLKMGNVVTITELDKFVHRRLGVKRRCDELLLLVVRSPFDMSVRSFSRASLNELSNNWINICDDAADDDPDPAHFFVQVIDRPYSDLVFVKVWFAHGREGRLLAIEEDHYTYPPFVMYFDRDGDAATLYKCVREHTDGLGVSFINIIILPGQTSKFQIEVPEDDGFLLNLGVNARICLVVQEVSFQKEKQ